MSIGEEIAGQWIADVDMDPACNVANRRYWAQGNIEGTFRGYWASGKPDGLYWFFPSRSEEGE